MKKEIKEFYIKIDTMNKDDVSVTITTTNGNEELMMSIPKIINMLNAEVSKESEKTAEPVLPKEWELEKCKEYFYLTYDARVINHYPLDTKLKDNRNRTLLPSKESAKNVWALCQLLTMRDRYVGDWKPDWNNTNTTKYCIISRCNVISVENWYNVKQTLSFPTEELAKEFLKNFKPLIEEAGDLI